MPMTDYETTSVFGAARACLDVTFLVLPGSSVMSVASAVDPLRAANRIEEREIFRWRVVTTRTARPCRPPPA